MGRGMDREALRIAAKRAPAPEARAGSDPWRCDEQLAGKVRGLLQANGFDAPPSLVGESPPTGDLPALQRALSAASQRVRRSLDELPPGTKRSTVMQLVDLGFELHEMSQEVYEERLSARTGLLSAVQGALSRLRGLDSTASVIKTATAEVCATGGFDRAMLFRLDRSRLVAEAAHFGGDDDWAAAVLDFARRIPPDLGEMLVESELARRRLPGVVQDPKRNPRAYRPLVIATDTNGYVAAPIAPEGRVIGFIHADCHSSGRPLEAADRDVLAAFAEGLGHATANAALRERLRREGRELGTLLRRTGEVVNGLANEGGDLASPGGGDDRREASRWPPTPSVTAPLSLTSRQNEVLRLLAEGATNAEIANRLIVSEHTVKSHIKHILRELGAANRTEAAASYHRLAAESRQV